MLSFITTLVSSVLLIIGIVVSTIGICCSYYAMVWLYELEQQVDDIRERDFFNEEA